MKSFVVLCLALMAAAIAIAHDAAAAAAPPQLPPGMTQAMFKQLMTPGPRHPAGIPADAQPYGGCIPTMGYHYANPKNWPFGPIYGWYQGKPTFTEVMIPQSAFNAGKSWDEVLKPLPGYKIDHVDIWFEPHGHPYYEVPHYDVHAWYVGHSTHMYYCNNPSGKKPAWL